MTAYLYVLSIGPVQDFIAAARRTRDLWMGSHLLSEISKAAARQIARSENGNLIFPALRTDNDRLNYKTDPDAYNVANIILAAIELPDGEDPTELNKRVQTAAQIEWEQYAIGAKNLAENLFEGSIDQDIWKDQVEDVIESYSAWVTLDKNDYQAARKRLMQLLAARKSTRDFKDAKGRPKIPKSSLDGARERVLMVNEMIESPRELALKMRLQAGEQLCAVGLTKRLGGRRADQMKKDEKVMLEVFPSVVRVASDPWIRGIIRSKGQAEEILEKIKQICSDNMRDNGNISQGTGRRYYQDFPYDGQVLHPSRITSMVNAHEKIRYSKGWEAYLSERDIDDLKKIKTLLERLQETGKMESGEKRLGFGEPERYYAILIADGDRMGKTISDPSMKTSKDHFRFSSKLARFAGIARKIVKRQHGCMVFSGGDDVLAFLPLDSCLQAARRLHYAFSTLLKRYPDEKGNPPTLSVGIAIVHSMEPLEDMLNFGRDAKNAAKRGKIAQDERDGLAIHLHPRSGVPIRIREQWRSKGKDGLDERLLRWSDMLISDQLPDAAAYDLHELAEDYRDWKVHSEEEKNGLAELIHADAWRLLKRKKADQRRGAPKGVTEKHFEEMLEDINSFEAISGLANELIVARRLAAAMIQARGRPLSEAKDQEVISS